MQDALEIAQTVQLLGGFCEKERCAEKLGKSLSGTFQTAISAAVKFALITNKKGILATTELYRNISLAYTPEERNRFLKESFFNVDLFRQLYDSYPVTTLKREILDKILVKEFNVDLRAGQQVARHYLDGLKTAQLDEVIEQTTDRVGIVSIDEIRLEPHSSQQSNEPQNGTNKEIDADAAPTEEKPSQVKQAFPYKMNIEGPEFSLQMTISSQRDFEIVEAVLQKVKSALQKS